MRIVYLIIIAIIAIFKIKPSEAAQCRLSNDHKVYICNGFRLNVLSASRRTREQIVESRIFDCKETQISEGVLTFPNLQNLTVSCDIEDIHEKAFQNLNHLQELNLGNNTISLITNRIFQPLSELRTLNLSHNQFEQLKENNFEGLNKLKQIILSFNKISSINQMVFDKTENLEEICLNNNQIKIIPTRTFNRLTKLCVIDLSHNNIKVLSFAFTLTYNLRQLNFSHNAITDIPLKIFQNTRIEVLDLSNNQLTIVYKDSLPLQTLKELYVQNNQIFLLDIIITSSTNILPLETLDIRNNKIVFLEDNFIQAAVKLVILKIDKNPWDCNCYDKMLTIRRNLSLTVSHNHNSGRDPVCVTSENSGNECIINKNNLENYYNLFKQTLR